MPRVPRRDELHELPRNLPVPADDGACTHLPRLALPAVALPSTAGRLVDLAGLPGRTVVYVSSPRTATASVPSRRVMV